MSAWRLQIYLVSDPTSQELVTALLSGIDGVVVEDVSSDFDHFVVVESTDATQAQGLLRLIQTIDPGVRLVHGERGRAEGRRAAFRAAGRARVDPAVADRAPDQPAQGG